MSKNSLYLLGILGSIILGCWLQWQFCCTACCENKPVLKQKNTISAEEIQIKNASSNTGFSFSTEANSYSTSQNFKFLKSDFNILNPVSDSINLGIEQLKILLKFEGNNFKITGFYKEIEENNSIFPDLGLARANAVKNYLVENGISENKIEITSQKAETLLEESDTVLNALSYEINSQNSSNSISETNNWNSLKTEINSNPIRLYFNTGQFDANLTNEDKVKLGKIMDYINHVENSKILITGHTDNTTGPNNTNEYYSKKRAEFAKQYLVKNGIDASKIVTEGKAEKQPIADNNTEEGRAKNRRSEIYIQ